MQMIISKMWFAFTEFLLKIWVHTLRIVHIHGAKTTKNQTSLVRFARLFYYERADCKIIKQNVPGGSVFSDFGTIYI